MSTKAEPRAPGRIYLQVGCDDPDCGNERCLEIHAYHEGVTWCADRIHANDTEYVRADVRDDLLAALEGLSTRLEREMESAGGPHIWWLPDNACAECMPGGEMVIDGFRCGRHATRHAIRKARGENR